jgi:demethylmenaquinone methyltransferase/2-methoxy-6-polyprenyl-1,4-benzoquinol methylase
MVTLATLGIDRRWKRRIVELLPPQPSAVLDLACGTGISTLAVADRYPYCRVVGVELREEYLERARLAILDNRIESEASRGACPQASCPR